VPLLGYAIGWYSHPNPGHSWPNSSRAYHGLVTAATPEGQATRKVLKPLVDARLAQGGAAVDGYTGGQDWLAFRSFDKDYDWWLDVSEWRRGVASAFFAAAQEWDLVVAKWVGGLSADD
jgi:hypothetical protein